MMTVGQAMQAFISSLEVSDREYDDAVRQREVIRGHLEDALSVSEFLISGSFKRKTAIRPLHDIDLFVVLDATTHQTLAAGEPIETLEAIQEVLDHAYPTKEHPILQRRSVNIEFSGTGLAFDVVPAFANGDDEYLIPDRDTNTWIRTNPRSHAEHATVANERAGKMAKPIVKALKRWSSCLPEKPVRSFHLELMVYEALEVKPDSYMAGIACALRRMADRVLRDMPEPAGIGPAVDQGMGLGERQAAARRFADGAAQAEEAIDLARRGATGEAHHIWRALLGAAYPEVGTPPKTTNARVASSIVVGGSRAPDSPGARFG